MYAIARAAAAIAAIRDGTASFEVRADLEDHLLALLRTPNGSDRVAARLAGLTDWGLVFSLERAEGPERRYTALDATGRGVVVTTYSGPHVQWVQVAPFPDRTEAGTADPRHEAFYTVWESLLGLADTDAQRLDPRRRAVFLVGLLESELMNGGFGQYLANTEGRYVDETIACLVGAGASTTATLLRQAADLTRGDGPAGVAGEAEALRLARLDEAFLGASEDLSGLVADAWLAV